MATDHNSLTHWAAVSPEKFRLAFESAPLAMVVTTPDGIVLEGNAAALRLSGYTAAEFTGKPVSQLYVEPDERGELLGRLMQQGSVSGEVITFKGKTGDPILGRVHMEPFTVNGTRVLFSTIEDLTALSRAHERLAESAERYRLVIEHSHDAIVLSDLDGNVVDANPAARRLFEVAAGETLNTAVLYQDVTDRDFVLAALATDGYVTDLTLRLKTCTGREFTASLNVSHWRDGGGRIVGTQASVRDISDRVAAEMELGATVQLLRAIIDASPLAVIGTDLNRRITLWNAAAEKLYGWSAGEVLGVDAGRLVPPDAIDEYERHRVDTLAGSPPREVSVTRRRKDGSNFLASLSFAAIQGNGVRPSGIMVMSEDITERCAIEDRLRQSQKLEAVGRLAGGVAHDFNNVLTVIMAEASAIRAATESGSEVALSAAEIENASRRAAALTRQLLAFSRQQVLAPTSFDLNDVVRDSERMLSRLIGETIRITVRLGPALWPITSEPTQVHQVLINLVINARDAMPQGGDVRIETRNVSSSETIPTVDGWLPAGDYVELTVQDTGIGMDATTIARAFEPFFTTKDKLGTGLGLSTVLGIAKQTGGGIGLETRVGHGTTFRVYFPRTTG